MAIVPKRYKELATEAQLTTAKEEAQTGMLTKLEFEQFKQNMMEVFVAITKQNNESADRINGKINA
ncbi:hypothetical protein [Xenorhabdus sp. PB30.3]|uniref:hypothetical protein n=1 Tax=Xenorhabdus sp. PB30.3 TaxID=2788941 RepID=UPI001E53212B|nr:hypothetical protein [Xenorhabdus sp. PB30.3]MCC8380058.1 hypothetical protein [Xenorhabdus sp. PB30.3]